MTMVKDERQFSSFYYILTADARELSAETGGYNCQDCAPKDFGLQISYSVDGEVGHYAVPWTIFERGFYQSWVNTATPRNVL